MPLGTLCLSTYPSRLPFPVLKLAKLPKHNSTQSAPLVSSLLLQTSLHVGDLGIYRPPVSYPPSPLPPLSPSSRTPFPSCCFPRPPGLSYFPLLPAAPFFACHLPMLVLLPCTCFLRSTASEAEWRQEESEEGSGEHEACSKGEEGEGHGGGRGVGRGDQRSSQMERLHRQLRLPRSHGASAAPDPGSQPTPSPDKVDDVVVKGLLRRARSQRGVPEGMARNRGKRGSETGV